MKRYERRSVSLSKCALNPAQDSAVGFYRVLQPGRFLKREGLVKEVRTIPFSGWGQATFRNYSDKTWMEICRGAQTLHSTLLWRQEEILRLLNLREHFKLKLIIDIDDNIFAAPSDNKAADHAEILRKNRELCLQLADGLTVSVPYLKELYGAYNKNIYVLPNGIDLPLITSQSSYRKKHKKLRIGWRGAYGHGQDLDLVKPALLEIKKKYDVEFVAFGVDPGFADIFVDWVPFFKEEVKGKTRVSYPCYYRNLTNLSCDIAIVPLLDSAYNRCKSNIATLEWSAIKVPVVFSPTENQKNCAGISASSNYEWYEALSRLLESETLRHEHAERQYMQVETLYSVQEQVKPFAKWLEKLPRRSDIAP